MRLLTLLAIIVVLVPAAAFSAVPANMDITFRAGQAFITWDEVTGGEKYIIYRSSSPISSGDLTSQNYRYEVLHGSANNKALDSLSHRVKTAWMDLTPPLMVTRNVINGIDPSTSGVATQVPDGTGLLVLTAHEDATWYYAVTAVVGGTEDKSGGNGNTFGPVVETVEDPEPVLIYQSDTMLARVYLQFIDVDSFNPKMANIVAWPYYVAVQSNGFSSPTEKVKMQLRLEGYHGNLQYCDNYQAGKDNGIIVRPHEVGNWWFGYSSTYDYDTSTYVYGSGSDAVTSGPIINYVQARVMNFLKWMLHVDPYYMAHVDTNRIYVGGGSMGGGGTLMMCQNYPDFFAYGAASVPPTNFLEADWNWLTNCRGKWGLGTDDHITVGFTGWRSEYLKENYEGMIFHEWMNHETMMSAFESVDLPFIAICHGGQDGSVTWPSQGKAYYKSLNDTRRAWSGCLNEWREHYCERNTNSQTTELRNNHSIVAFSNVGQNGTLPLPDAPSTTVDAYICFNKTAYFSTPYFQVGGVQDIVDELNRYEIVLISNGGDDVADVTPRRLQNFVVTAGEEYVVKNTAVSDTNTVYQERTITADAQGLVTFTGFELKNGDWTSGGSRLVIYPVVPAAAVVEASEVESEVSLKCMPNPFNPTLKIAVRTAANTKRSKVTVQVFNSRGEKIDSRISFNNSGYQEFNLNSISWSSGAYIVKADVNGRVMTKRVMLLK